MNTGENTQGLLRIVDMTRAISMFILAIHFYYHGHAVFAHWNLTHEWIDKIIIIIARTGIVKSILAVKACSLLCLVVSLIGAQGKKEEKINLRLAIAYLLVGALLFLLSHAVMELAFSLLTLFTIYMIVCLTGFILVLTGGTIISKYIKLKLNTDIFNEENESFPQEERLLENEYSINIPAQYKWKGKLRKSWINFINPFRALLVIGTPGAGKSYFVIRHVITQLIKKGFCMFIYDFKYSDLSIIAYNTLLKYSHRYKVKPKFYVITLDHINHRCNPLDPKTMVDITDASESSRTIMLGLNRDWIKKQGDFFVESPINFVTAIIWFLFKFKDGIYCTLPHVIELMQIEYRTLFPLLNTEPEIEVLINPFESAFRNEAFEQLEGQIASAKIGMARLSSPLLYYVLVGNDLTLDINNPKEPKIVCMGNNPQKQQIFGAVISLYISRLTKLINKKGMTKCAIIADEFTTAFWGWIEVLIATARSNLVAVILAVQDYAQLKKDYGREIAEVILNIVGNIISGQVFGDTAKQLSERFGKIVQTRESVSINRNDTSVSRSSQLDSAIPPSKIASLSSGEFVGMVADDPQQKIKLKTFHAEILNDHAAIKKETDAYVPIPPVREVTDYEIQKCYYTIKEDIQRIIIDRLKISAK